MLPREVLRQVRRLQIRARRAVEDMLGGEYHSVFKGMGIAFEEVREYQPGDEVRAIDWNVTARMGHPFVKRFVEERELTVMLVVDFSGSQDFGTRGNKKREVAAEMAAILAFSAIANNDRVGLIAFTDRVERFVPPRKGTRHVLRLIRDLLFHQPERTNTSLSQPLDYLNHVLHRRSIVFLVSDLLDQGFERAFKLTAQRHDLIVAWITDPMEAKLSPVGFLQVDDAETGNHLMLDTNDQEVRRKYVEVYQGRCNEVRRLAQVAGVDLIEVSTAGGHLEALIRFFQLRERRLRRV